MSDAAVLSDSFQSISSLTDRDMSERDVENLFLEHGFYAALGYTGTGVDVRSEFTLPDDRRPDYITLNSNEAVTAVYEFKTTGRDLSPHESQLFGYMDDLRAEYGVLTNGEELRLYRQGEQSPQLVTTLDTVSENEIRNLHQALQKREFDLTDADDLNRFRAEVDPIRLDRRSELGQEHFFDTFRLEEGSPFADLVTGMMDLLIELRDEQEAKFVKGAYDFWEATYASEPDEMPSSWEPFVDGAGSLRDFMFCLESGHALLSRLLLAKATEDHDFFAGTGYSGMDGYFDELQGFGESINPDAFPVAANNLIADMENELVEGLFQDDIFVWWTDGYQQEMSRQHGTGASQFEAVATGRGEEGGVTRISDATREQFSRAVGDVFLNILRFDFADVEGDLLGDLYQRYFDPETRKALGEFYTPQEVVDYIMDGVGYDRGVSNERLMDPACGSGTFLVEAVERYVEDVRRYHDDPDWEAHLRDLCTRPRVVGLDIHPFAVLMAQIRFVVAILPAYREAKQQSPNFTLRRLPIYRTDTLRNEKELSGVDLGTGDAGSWQSPLQAWEEDETEVRVPVPLPVEVDDDEDVETEDGFLVRRVRMPLFSTIRAETEVRNFGEYFAAIQGVLDTVKDHMAEFGDVADWDWTYGGGVEERINFYTERDYSGLESFFAEYVDDILENVRYLKEEHNDGRLFKMFEDTVLALVVKNYMEYDYVVGNPPYVRIQNLPDRQKEMMDRLYDATTGNYDIYCPFYERGLDWLYEGTGRLGFITPNQFMITDYGEGLRRVILDEACIEEVYDFRDSGVFEDAKNYPAIVILQNESDSEIRESNNIRCVRVKADTKAPTNRDLDTAVLEAVRDHRDDPGYKDGLIDVFDYPQGDLDDGYWSLMPPEELDIIQKMEAVSDSNVGDVTDSVFAGTQTSANNVFLVTPINADRISADDAGEVVRVIPKGSDKEYEIETDTLRPWLQGRDIHRWRGDWSGEHAIVPYVTEQDSQGQPSSTLISQERLENELPLTWAYLTEHRDTLESREGGRFKHRNDWYGFGYPKNMTRFEEPKLIGSEIAAESTFMVDDIGTWYFKAAYGVQLEQEYKDRTNTLAALLNSNAFDFYLKHYTVLKVDGFYKYTTNYLTPVPIVWGDEGDRADLRSIISSITTALDTASKTERFPEAYIGEYGGELEYITYEWQTRRYPVEADIQSDVDGEFAVQAGRSDTITDPAMYAPDRDERKRRAKYVSEAVNDRNVKSGEEMTIPIPRSDKGVAELLDSLRSDEAIVSEIDTNELEDTLNQVIYEMFGISSTEQDVIEDYLETFRVY